MEYLYNLIARLLEAKISAGEVALAISEVEERRILEDISINAQLLPLTLHHAEYMGYRIIVKGRNE
jgi:hypothetical protein